MATDFEKGLLVGLLIGEGHFGGDGRQPQVTLRMHVRHAALFRWIERVFPGGRTYGPYDHGGRHYLQWMARGAYLRNEIAPLVRSSLSDEIDTYARQRFDQMQGRYAAKLGLADSANAEAVIGESTPSTEAEPASSSPDLDQLFRRLRQSDETGGANS